MCKQIMGKALFNFQSIVLIGILLIIPFRYESLIGLSSLLVLAGAMVMFFLSLTKKKSRDIELFVFILLPAFSYLIKPFNYDIWVSCFMFFSMTTIWASYKTVRIEDSRSLSLFYIIASLIIIALSFMPFAYRIVENYGSVQGVEVTSDALTLGFNNPNETGMLLYLVITILISILITHKKPIRFVVGGIAVFLIYLLIQTGCRTSLFSLIIVIIAYLFRKVTVSLVLKKRILLVLLLMPLLFSYLYPLLALRYGSLDYEILGKPLFSGREILFVEGFSHFISNPIIGDINFFKFENAFNGFLSVMFNTGIVGILFYLYFLIKTSVSLSRNICTSSQYFAFLSLLGVLFVACSESAILTGGSQWYVLLLTLYVIANNPMLSSYNKRVVTH